MRSAQLNTLFHIPSRCRRTRPDREVNTGFHFEKGNGFASDGSSRKAEPSAPYSRMRRWRQRCGWGHITRSRLPRNGSPPGHHTAGLAPKQDQTAATARRPPAGSDGASGWQTRCRRAAHIHRRRCRNAVPEHAAIRQDQFHPPSRPGIAPCQCTGNPDSTGNRLRQDS